MRRNEENEIHRTGAFAIQVWIFFLCVFSLAFPAAKAWSLLPPGCASGFNIKQDGTQDFTTIQAGINALPKNLTATTCIVIRDAQTYAEQVTVQGFANNGFQLAIGHGIQHGSADE